MECRLGWRPSFPVSFARAKGPGQNLEERLKLGLVRREPQWSESIAVGSREFVEAMLGRVAHRRGLRPPRSIWSPMPGLSVKCPSLRCQIRTQKSSYKAQE